MSAVDSTPVPPATASAAAARGIVFPVDASGERRSTPVARAVVADALSAVDASAGEAVTARGRSWRSDYVTHFLRLVQAGLASPEDWLGIARAGLASVHDRMTVLPVDGGELPLRSLLEAPAERALDTVRIDGDVAAEDELVLPYRGHQLRGDTLRRQLETWTTRGVLEPTAAEQVRTVLDHPEWLALPGRVVAVLGAGAEMGPVPSLLRWGATVAAVDLPRRPIWDRLRQTAADSAGTLLVPTSANATAPGADAGVDLLSEVPAVADWLLGLDGRLVLGNYLYADGATHVRVSVAADVLAERLRRSREDLALAFLATPTDAFAVPPAVVAQARDAFRRRSVLSRVLGGASGGMLLQPSYAEGDEPQICDSLVPAQGPNYALAKRIQRWRAAVARAEGLAVSFHVAPASRTRSVLKNKALAAAFAGAHRFGVEVFEPATANVLMAALLVHDLHADPVRHPHPCQDEAHAAVHGGLWREPYAPRTALNLAALMGAPTSLVSGSRG